jgi:hypothetical protein
VDYAAWVLKSNLAVRLIGTLSLDFLNSDRLIISDVYKLEHRLTLMMTAEVTPTCK